MLKIENLKTTVNEKNILNGLNLNIKAGEVHAIMGPNGSGKSTLANVLSGKKGYEVSGNITFNGENLNQMEIDERAQKGVFLAFQYPLEIPGVNTNNFLNNYGKKNNIICFEHDPNIGGRFSIFCKCFLHNAFPLESSTLYLEGIRLSISGDHSE